MNNCDCNQGRLPCTCKRVPRVGEGLDANELSALRICAKLGHSTTPEVLLRLLGMVKPVPPAGDVPEYFIAACDKFDWTPEEALRFYAEGKHFDTADGRTRILCTGAIASHALKGLAGPYADMKGIEPAGDVEVLESVTRFDIEAMDSDRWGMNKGPEGTYCNYEEAQDECLSIVTRLTADLAQAEHMRKFWAASAATLSDQNDALKSELARARELIEKLCYSFDESERTQAVKDLKKWRHESAPAAKGGSDVD